jgi:hypothetical protein
MPTVVPEEIWSSIQVAITYAMLACGSLTVVFSVAFLGGRVVRPRAMRRRLRTGLGAAILVIALATLDIYLAITAV